MVKVRHDLLLSLIFDKVLQLFTLVLWSYGKIVEELDKVVGRQATAGCTALSLV